MLKSRLCSYIDAYILVKGSVSVGNTTVENVNTNKIYKKWFVKILHHFLIALAK